MQRNKSLSRREEEVATLLLRGRSNKQIAAALHISERTVEFHLKNIFDKYDVGSRVELVLKLGKSTGAVTGNPVESTVDAARDNVHNGRQNGSQNNGAQSWKTDLPGNRKEFAMSKEIRSILGGITVVMGIVLMVGGIITDKSGAVVVGLCVSAAAVAALIVAWKQPGQAKK